MKECLLNPSRLRLGVALIIVLMVISSPAVMLVNPTLIAAPLSKDGGSVDAAPSTISQEGDFTAQGALVVPSVTQSSDIVNSFVTYEVAFTTATAGAIDKIQIDFPAGTNIGSSGVIERVGIGSGSLTKAGSTLTYDVHTPVNRPAGTFIRLEIVGIKNPSIPEFLTATITTMDSGNTIIDGPSTTNAYVIKQIGTVDIAPGSIEPAAGESFGPDTEVPPLSFGQSDAICEEGTQVVGGGFSIFGGGAAVSALELASESNNGVGWTVVMFNTDDTVSHSFQALAECMPALP